jgi:hypothetical protein
VASLPGLFTHHLIGFDLVNYVDTFIAVADDCPVARAVVPQKRAGKSTVAVIHYELLAGNPYQLTQEDILFQTHARARGIATTRVARAAFFAKDQPCLRASPLARRYGWGFHCDATGKIALYAVGSREYDQLSANATKVIKALRSSRG